MAKVWGLDIPEEFAQFFQDFFKLDWQASNRRITKKKSTPGKIKGSWLAEFSKLPGYAQSWAGLTEQQQNTFITDWGSNAQQAFALYTQQCWYRELNSMPARTTADYYSHPIGHIHAAESDSDILLNFEVASGDYIMSAPSNIKKIQIPTQQFFANLTQLNFSLKIRQSGASDNGTIWYLYYIKIYGDDPETPKYEDESEEWTNIMAGATLNLQADNVDEWMDGENVSKIQVSLELYIASGDLWIYDANITGIDSILGVIRLNNSNFLADISQEFQKYAATIKNQWSISDAAAGSYLQYDYPYATGLAEADAGWYLTRIADISETATIETAQDSDGSHLIAAVYNGRLYTSADGGASWTERQPAGAANKNWRAVASDGDGSHLIAAIFLGRLYTSADGGASWTERQPAGDTNIDWQAVASDGDGSHLIAGERSGRLYTSADGGASWTERQPAGNYDKQWWAMAMDSDGSHLIVGEYSGRLYTSADGGASWTERQPAGNYNKKWLSAAMDSDGSHLIAGAYGGRLYTSADGGASWTERQPAGATNKNWCAVASDGDGSHLIAAIENEKIYESTDGGASWTEIKPVGGLVGRWQSLGMSDDGSNQHVAPFAGKILIKV